MASVALFDMQGKEAGQLSLPDAIFGVEYNDALVHQAIVAEEADRKSVV